MNKIVYLDEYKKSPHSNKRSQQRSVKNKILVDVLNYSDREENCGKGCMRHIVTKKRQISLIKESIKVIENDKSKKMMLSGYLFFSSTIKQNLHTLIVFHLALH